MKKPLRVVAVGSSNDIIITWITVCFASNRSLGLDPPRENHPDLSVIWTDHAFCFGKLQVK
jgi:hypothetical protein